MVILYIEMSAEQSRVRKLGLWQQKKFLVITAACIVDIQKSIVDIQTNISSILVLILRHSRNSRTPKQRQLIEPILYSLLLHIFLKIEDTA